MEGDSFYITLPSDASMARHAANQGGRYTVELPQQVQVNSHFWECGLAEIVFNQDWLAFSDDDIWVRVSVNDVENGTWSSSAAEFCSGDNLQKASQLSPNDFVKNVVQPTIERALASANIEDIALVFNVDNTGRVQFTTPTKSATGMPVRIELSTMLNQILGFSAAQLTESRYFQSSYPDGVIKSPTSDFPCDVTRGITLLMVYTNIVRPHMTGHSMSPLLRAVPVDSRIDKLTTRVVTYERPQYFPLNQDSFENITIEIYNIAGKRPVRFAAPVICKLHLRRRKPWVVNSAAN